jgi:hypothetical protein
MLPRPPVEWNSNRMGWNRYSCRFPSRSLVFPLLFTLVSSHRHSLSLCVCVRLTSCPCHRQVNFRSLTVIATNYARARSLQQNWTRFTAIRCTLIWMCSLYNHYFDRLICNGVTLTCELLLHLWGKEHYYNVRYFPGKWNYFLKKS